MGATVTSDVRGTVSRTVELIRKIAEAGGDVTIKGLSESLNLSASTVHRLLHLLIEEGLVERAPLRRYRIGPELMRISAVVGERIDLPNLSLGFMQKVVEAVDETCLFGLYRPYDRTMNFVARVDSTQPLRYRIQLNRPVSVAWGASGLSILAFLPPEDAEAVMKSAQSSPVTGAAFPTRDAMQKKLSDIRRRGFAITHGEKYSTAVGISAPVFRSASVIGSFCITLPEFRYPKKREHQFVELVVAAAANFSRVLGTN